MTLDMLLKTAWLSLRFPRLGFRVVLSWRLSLMESALALTLMAIVSAVLVSPFIKLPPEIDPISAAMLTNPLYLALVQLAGLAMIAVMVHLLGRFTKGRGTLPEAVAMFAWAEVLWIAISVVETLVLILLPPLGVLVVLIGTLMSLWLLVNFTAELHGYASLPLTLLGVIAAGVAALFGTMVLFFLLFILGVLHV